MTSEHRECLSRLIGAMVIDKAELLNTLNFANSLSTMEEASGDKDDIVFSLMGASASIRDAIHSLEVAHTLYARAAEKVDKAENENKGE